MVSVQEVFERFVVRDLMGYVIPGAVAGCALAFCSPEPDVDHLAVYASLPKLAFVTLIVCYLSGFACGAVNDAAGLLAGAVAKLLPRSLTKRLHPVPAFDQKAAQEYLRAFSEPESRRYVQRLEDLALLTGHAGAATLALIVARLWFAHPTYANTVDTRPLLIAFRCLTTTVLWVLGTAGVLLLWYGAWCHQDARAFTKLLADETVPRPNAATAPAPPP